MKYAARKINGRIVMFCDKIHLLEKKIRILTQYTETVDPHAPLKKDLCKKIISKMPSSVSARMEKEKNELELRAMACLSGSAAVN